MGQDWTPHPLHFSTVPKGGKPEHAELLGAGMLLAWCATRKGLGKRQKKDLVKKLVAREITGRQALASACKNKLTSDDIPASLHDFISGYAQRLFLGRDDKDGAKKVQALLHLHRPDEISFNDDYLGTFSKIVSNPFLVPDTWEAFDRLAAILDARYADFSKTKFEGKTPIAIYEKATRERDKHTFEIATPKNEAATIDDALLDDLLACVGKTVSDAKPVLVRAKLPIGKKIDKQANAALGVSYMGAKIKGKLCVTDVTFYEEGATAHVRSLGAELEFSRWPGKLPKNLPGFPITRQQLIAKLGKPTRDTSDWIDVTFAKEKRTLECRVENKKIVRVTWSLVEEDE